MTGRDSRSRLGATPFSRWVSALLLAASSLLLAVGAQLDADRAGYGTHVQLGLPPCGFLATCGVPCATCGMTTAFTHAVHGSLMAALLVQPTGALFALLVAILAIVSGYSLISGVCLAPLGRWLWRPRSALVLGAMVVGSWAYKIFQFSG